MGPIDAQARMMSLVVEFSRRHALSVREVEVLKHAACGRSTKEIASCLHCSQSTVQTYWMRIVRKTRRSCRAQVIAGLLELAPNE